MVYWKAKHGILQAEKACFAMKSDRIKSFLKNSSLVTTLYNFLYCSMLRCDELQLQLVTPCLIKDKILFFLI